MTWSIAASDRWRDLKSACGRAAAARLIAGADLLIEGFRPGVMLERLVSASNRDANANANVRRSLMRWMTDVASRVLSNQNGLFVSTSE